MNSETAPTFAIQKSDCDLIVYHDGACPICSVEIGHYKKQAGAERIRFIDATKAEETEFGPGLDRDIALQRFHVRLPNGELASGAEGFAKLWQTLPKYRVLGRIAEFPLIIHALEGLYRLVLPVRARLSAWLKRPATG